MAGTTKNDALGWLHVGWRLSQMVKPVRTIDEIVLVLGDLPARRADATTAEMQVRGELAAARVAVSSLESRGADTPALESMQQRVQVLEDLRFPLPEADPLSGSLNSRARPDAPLVITDARLQPATAPRGGLAVTEAFRTLAAGLAGTADDRRVTTARLAGQKEALRAVAASLETQLEADTGEAADRLRTTIEGRLEAIDAAAAALVPAARTPSPAGASPVEGRGSRPFGARRREAIPLVPEAEE